MRLVISGLSSLILGLTIAGTAQAQVRRLNHQLDSSANYTNFETMLKQAESVAQEAANQSFAVAGVTEVSINISGEQSGQVLPVLVLSVSKENWQRQPSVRVWAKYPGGVKQLLGFGRSNLGPIGSSVMTAANPIRDGLTEKEANFYDKR